MGARKMEFKTCSKCKETFPATEEFFRWHNKKKGKLYSQCRPCAKEAGRAYYEVNKEKIKEYSKAYRDSHKDYYNNYTKQWRLDNTEQQRSLVRAWKKANPEKKKGYEKKRTSIKRGYSEFSLIQTYGVLCHLCFKPIDFSAPRQCGVEGWEMSLHIDHYIPLSKGGEDEVDNVRPSHAKCNVTRKTAPVEVYRAPLYGLPNRH
jgi:5-methylcytosine-specific restriction endonuclease McrA